MGGEGEGEGVGVGEGEGEGHIGVHRGVRVKGHTGV